MFGATLSSNKHHQIIAAFLEDCFSGSRKVPIICLCILFFILFGRLKSTATLVFCIVCIVQTFGKLIWFLLQMSFPHPLEHIQKQASPQTGQPRTVSLQARLPFFLHRLDLSVFRQAHIVQSLDQAQAVRDAQGGLSLVPPALRKCVGPGVRPGFESCHSAIMWCKQSTSPSLRFLVFKREY